MVTLMKRPESSPVPGRWSSARTSSTQGPETFTVTGAQAGYLPPPSTSVNSTPVKSPPDPRVGDDGRAVIAGGDGVLNGDPLRVLDLRVVVESGGLQPPGWVPAHSPELSCG